MPTALKIITGNLGKRPLPDNEPMPPIVDLKIPKDLKGEAKIFWKKYAPQLIRLGVLTEADAEAFEHLCRVQGILMNLYKLSEKNPSMIQEKVTVDGSGQEHSSYTIDPYVNAIAKYVPIYRQLCQEFGLTPRGRVGLKTMSKSKKGMEALID